MAKKSFKMPNYKKAVAANTEKQRSAASTYGYLKLPKGVGLFKERKGRIQLDVIPYPITNEKHADICSDAGIEVGVLWYKSPFKVHRDIGAGDGQTVVCPTTVGLPCPICEYRNRRAKEGADRDELKALKTSSRNLYAVIPRKDKEMDETIHIWNTSQFFVQDAINNELEEDEELYEFPDLENGYRLNIRFDEESFMGNKYYRPSRIDFDDRDPLPPSILDNVPKLDDCLAILSYAELSAMLFQIDTDDVEIEDDCEVEETRPRRRRKSVVVEEDENEEMEEQEDFEEDENEEIEEKTPPRRRRKSVIKEVEVEEEQEEEEDVEEQEEEKPRKVESAKGSNRIRERKTAKVTEEPEIEEESNETTTKCPFGHYFGIDNDKVPKDCNKCDVWDDCYDAFFEGEE